MNLKDRVSAFENDAKILERIAGKYDEASTEHAALKHGRYRSLVRVDQQL